MRYTFLFSFLLVIITNPAFAQASLVRGNIVDAASGQPVAFASVQISGTGLGTISDENGFYSIPEVPTGDWVLQVRFLGYAPIDTAIAVEAGRIYYRRIALVPDAVELETIDISARRERDRSSVNMSARRLESEDFAQLPNIGSTPDLAQYLTVLPGIVSTGDQGGQLFIRGGSPSQQKVLLDGLTIFNPFHSIGLFSVFETEAIQSADVLTGGFQANHGGRLSAILDIKTRAGHQKGWHGLVSASPFQARSLIEGPIVKSTDEKPGSVSLLVTGKYGYLDQTSPALYPNAANQSILSQDALGAGEEGLPYSYQDLYGKVSFNGSSGSRADLFGLYFSDQFAVDGVASLDWTVSGGGANFRLIPPNSGAVLDGVVGYTSYLTELVETDGAPRSSGVVNYTAQLNFSYFNSRSTLRYGLDFTGFNTDFRFENGLGLTVTQRDFTSEIAGYLTFQYRWPSWIIEPGLRIHYYAAQSYVSPEPRIGAKYLVSDNFRIKAGGGLYSQNMLGTTNDEDVVNFFVGYLAGPQEPVSGPDGNQLDQTVQLASHLLLGAEWDASRQLLIRLEGYYKSFDPLLVLNRNKRSGADPDFSAETGRAYGAETTIEYRNRGWYGYVGYALSWVDRNDGMQIYPTVFDRRHNLNILGQYTWGSRKNWDVSVRWNLGSPFPFTQTIGFFQDVPADEWLAGNSFLTGNFPLGVLLSSERNGGRLSYYHRLDLGLTYRYWFSQNPDSETHLETSFSVSNAYNRENIFFVDRLTSNKVNQLPVLPSLALTFHW